MGTIPGTGFYIRCVALGAFTTEGVRLLRKAARRPRALPGAIRRDRCESLHDSSLRFSGRQDAIDLRCAVAIDLFQTRIDLRSLQEGGVIEVGDYIASLETCGDHTAGEFDLPAGDRYPVVVQSYISELQVGRIQTYDVSGVRALARVGGPWGAVKAEVGDGLGWVCNFKRPGAREGARFGSFPGTESDYFIASRADSSSALA